MNLGLKLEEVREEVLKEKDGTAYHILKGLGLKSAKVKSEIMNLLGHKEEPDRLTLNGKQYVLIPVEQYKKMKKLAGE